MASRRVAASAALLCYLAQALPVEWLCRCAAQPVATAAPCANDDRIAEQVELDGDRVVAGRGEV